MNTSIFSSDVPANALYHCLPFILANACPFVDNDFERFFKWSKCCINIHTAISSMVCVYSYEVRYASNGWEGTLF